MSHNTASTGQHAAHGTAVASDFLLRRRDERRDCKVNCSFETLFGTARCQMLNISIGGIGIQTDSIVVLKVGQKIKIKDGPLTDITGIVRWAGHPRYGIEFDAASRGNPHIPKFYDTLKPQG